MIITVMILEAGQAMRCTHPDTQTENFATQSWSETGEAAAAVQRVQTLHTRLPPFGHWCASIFREDARKCLLLVYLRTVIGPLA